MATHNTIFFASSSRLDLHSPNDLASTRLPPAPPSHSPKIPYPRRLSSLYFPASHRTMLPTSASHGTLLPTIRETRASSVVSASSAPTLEVDATTGPTTTGLPSAPPSEGLGPPATSANSGTILALVFAVLFLIVVVTLGMYGCASSFQKRTTHTDYLRSLHQKNQRDHEHDEDHHPADERVERQDLEAHGPSYGAEVVVATAQQGRVYGAGAASMVDVVKGRRSPRGGSAGGSDSGESSRSVVDVGSLPDLWGAQALLSQGGGRASSGKYMSLKEALSDDTAEATQGSRGTSSRQKEARSDEDMTLGERSDGRASTEYLLPKSVSRGENMAQAGRLVSRDRLSLREALEEDNLQPLPAAKGKSRRRVLRKRVKSKSMLSDMLKVYAA